MKIRTAALAALAAALAVPGAADAKKPAAPKAIVIEDLAGDANAINPQSTTAPVPSTATPAQAGPWDIRTVKIVTDKAGAAASKMTVTLTLAEAPTTGGLYRVLSDIGGCAFWTEFTPRPSPLVTTAAVRVCDEGVTGYAYTDVPTKVEGTSIVWTIPINAFKGKGLKPGAMIGNIGADARVSAVAVTIPSVDNLKTDKVYKVGQ